MRALLFQPTVIDGLYMALIFYAHPLSTYCAKVRIVLKLKSIDFDEHIPPGGSYNSTLITSWLLRARYLQSKINLLSFTIRMQSSST